MKKFIIFFCSLMLVALRFYLSLLLLWSGSMSGVLLAVSGLIAVWTTVLAYDRGSPDFSMTGLFVGFGYLAPLAFLPSNVHNVFIAPVFWLLFGIQCYVRWTLGSRCTVAAPVFVSVIDKGLYAKVRHPMTFIELLMSSVFACEFPSVWNTCVLVVMVFVKMAINLCEEKFLNKYSEYRIYSARVAWRWLPGVW